MTIQINLTAKWQLKSNPNYVWTTCKKLVNLKTGRICKKTFNGRGTKAGYWIDSKFIKLVDLKNDIELITNQTVKCPF